MQSRAKAVAQGKDEGAGTGPHRVHTGHCEGLETLWMLRETWCWAWRGPEQFRKKLGSKNGGLTVDAKWFTIGGTLDMWERQSETVAVWMWAPFTDVKSCRGGAVERQTLTWQADLWSRLPPCPSTFLTVWFSPPWNSHTHKGSLNRILFFRCLTTLAVFKSSASAKKQSRGTLASCVNDHKCDVKLLLMFYTRLFRFTFCCCSLCFFISITLGHWWRHSEVFVENAPFGAVKGSGYGPGG